MLCAPAFKAAGDIYPCRFVSMSDNSGKDFYVEETATATLSEQMIGISGESGKDGRVDVNNTKHAESEDTCDVFGTGDVCLLELAGSVDRGNLLKPNITTDGKGIIVDLSSGGAQYYGARALQSGSSGEKIRVVVERGWITT